MLRKNTAGQFAYFCLVNATTGAALTGATVTAKRSIDGAAQASCTGTVNEDAGGQYHIALSQADTNGNDIGYLFTATGAIPVSIMVVTTACDPTNATTFGIGALPGTVCTGNASLITSGTGTDQLSVSAGKTLLQATQTGVTIPTVTTVGTLTTYTGNTPQTGDSYTRIGVAGAGLTNIVLPASGLANVTAWTVAITGNLSGSVGSVTDAVTLPANPPAGFIVATSFGAAAITSTVAPNLDVAVSSRLATTGYTAPDNTDIAAILTDALTLLGRIGANVALNIDMQTALSDLETLLTRISGVVALTSQIPADFTSALFASAGVFSVGALVNAPTGGGGNVTVGGYVTGQDPATLVLDAEGSAHNNAGSVGAKINAAGGAADPLANTAAAYTQPQLGWVIGQLLNTPITVVGPMPLVVGQPFTIIRGDDYFLTENRALTFAMPVGGGIPDLTGLEVFAAFFSNYTIPPAVHLTLQQSATNPGGANQELVLQPDDVQTSLLISPGYTVAFYIVLPNGHKYTFARANGVVQSQSN